jgi:hypothetical protein
MHELNIQGFQLNQTVLSNTIVDQLLDLIWTNSYNQGFGIREFLLKNPNVTVTLQNEPVFCQLIKQHLPNPVCIRSIYFDKPPKANWVVGWHQDLTVNLNNDPKGKGWQNIRNLNQRTVAQPPLSFLENMVTIRLHLDETDDTNGALRVVPGSHRNGVIRTDSPHMATLQKSAIACHIDRGGAMLMKPLTLHASRRSIGNNSSRRVIHLEFADQSSITALDLQEEINF